MELLVTTWVNFNWAWENLAPWRFTATVLEQGLVAGCLAGRCWFGTI